MILIVSNKSDLATDFLILRLHEKGIPFRRINTEEFLSVWNVNIFLDNEHEDCVICFDDGSVLQVSTITGAYIRQPKLPSLNISGEEIEFAKREIGETLKSLWRFIQDPIWLNAPHKILRASNKPEQLHIAHDLGFRIPNTCITADKESINSFYEKNQKDIIVKAVKHGFVLDAGNSKVATTRIIDHESIQKIDNYERIPMIIQKRIEKKFDVRVTVVGNRIFATAIHSQQHLQTAVDWRLADQYEIKLKHEAINLPEDVEKLCHAIVSKFQLSYAAIDLILSKDEEYYFLEMNPNGQWAWIEQLTGWPIRDAIIDELTYQG